MKANEFVKKFGLDSFKAAIFCPQFKRYSYAILYSDEVDFSNNFIGKHSDYMFKTSEIKRLVESNELVINWKLPEDDETGLDGAHLYLDCYATYSNDEEKAKLDRLKQAIADVESCQ